MPQSLARILVHIIFSTKNREPFLKYEIRDELHRYLAATIKAIDSPALIVGSATDHVHILCVLSKNQAACKAVEEIKKSSSKWLKTKGDGFAKFQWQSGYGAFSVSESHVAVVERYIANQSEHHRRRTFEEEFRVFLRKHRVPFDERYVWD